MDYQHALIEFISNDLLLGMGDAPVAADENLLTSGLVDSLGVMRLVLFMEEEFGVQVPPEDVTIEHFLTVETMAAYLQARRPAESVQ